MKYLSCWKKHYTRRSLSKDCCPELTYKATATNADPKKLRQAIICLTVKTEAVTAAGALGGAVGGLGGPAMPVTVPAGAIILSVGIDKLADFMINRIEWCKL